MIGIESKRIFYLLLFILVTVSCAVRKPGSRVEAADGAEQTPRFAVPGGSPPHPREISARVRIELPRYRVRGICGVHWSGDGFLQVDFDHSSLFGALRREATILIGGGSIEIRDDSRGEVVRDEEALAMLGDQLGIEVCADDIVYLLLLLPLPLGEEGPVEVERRGDEVAVRGLWRGRAVEIAGPPGLPPRRLRVISAGGIGYETRYGYPKGAPDAYPERIVFERTGGGGRISLTIESSGVGRE
ncbi:MAG: hypothetical protein PHQ19_01700 [Candidatus Krumholzibacteria bacterium]|nr:hypothetical protein [Candidatus Krumholzibacteria bacterium]